MQESRFLCLAVSRRDGGKCIAGIDLDSSRWIRPVDVNSHGAISNGIAIASEGSNQIRWLESLDIVCLPLGNHVGTTIQPENWELLPTTNRQAYEALRRFDLRHDMEILTGHLEGHGPLLHSYGDSISAPALGARKLDHSLSLIEPDDLYWKVEPKQKYPTELQIRADFSFDDDRYNISVTDSVWETRCIRAGKGGHRNAEIADAARPRILLVVSLGAKPLNGQHYKFVAGVLALPA